MQYGKHRVLEILPGALIWGTYLLAIAGSFFWPTGAIVFIIIFDLYWLFRVLYFVVYLLTSWRRYKRAMMIDWQARVHELPNWQRVYHLVFLPTYKEPVELVRRALKALDQSSYPNDHLIVVLAGESRDHAAFARSAERLQKEFGDRFFRLWVTEHPVGLPDEIPGKGSNLNWSAHQVKPQMEALKIAPENVIVSSFDVDSVPHPQYLACLTHAYLTDPNPTRSSYQPVTIFSNNIWTSTTPVRIASFGTTFWLLTELARPERLWTFSSHSMPWKMLLDVGFWEKDMVSEDSRIFLQGLIHYHGDYRVTPIYLPVSMDAVTGKHYVDSLVALYKQQRRWAWGVEHFPYMVEKFRQDTQMPLRVKVKYLWNHLEGIYTWSTAPVLIFILGYLPLYVAKHTSSVLVASAPFTLEWIMRLAMIGALVSGVLGMIMLPPRPSGVRRRAWLVMVLQWALMPVTFILFGALPALDAQTRFMLGKYLGFNVTRKSASPH